METTSDIKILQIKEIPFELNRKIDNVSTDMMKDVVFSFLLVLQHQQGNDVVGLHSVMRYYVPKTKEVLLQGGASFIVQVNNWQSIAASDATIRSSHEVKELVLYANAFVSGMFFKQTAGTSLNAAFIPKWPIKELMDGMKIEILP